MQSFDISSIFTHGLVSLSAGVLVILCFSVLVTFLSLIVSTDLYKREGQSIPLISLSLCSMGFSLIAFFFVYPPVWLEANSLSLFGLGIFAIVWALGSSTSFGLVAISTYIPSYLLLLQSQASTDARALWIRLISQPQSWAISIMSMTVLVVILCGSLCRQKLVDSYGQRYAFFLLVSCAFVGLLLGTSSHFLTHMVSAVFAHYPN